LRVLERLRKLLAPYAYTRRAMALVWETSPRLMIVFAVLTVAAGSLPAAIAYVGKLIVDAVVAASRTGDPDAQRWALTAVAIEAALVIAMAAMQKGLGVAEQLLRALLGNKVNVMILEKALTLGLVHFEDADLYDKMTRARREASSRPLSLVRRSFGLVQNAVSLVSYGVLLLHFSPWAVLILGVAAVPAFVAETKFAGEAFRLFKWRTPETRQQLYLETIIAREDYAKEVKLLGVGPLFLGRYKDIFDRLYGEDRDLTIRRGAWGFLLGLLSTAAFYGAYGWIVVAAIAARITLGEMTMYLLVFKQGQSAFAAILQGIGGMYEDNLYLSNLYEFLEEEIEAPLDAGAARGPDPDDGIRIEDVSFTYAGATTPALDHVTLHVRPGEKVALVGENGSGKTTLIKLVAGLYVPTTGRVLFEGLDVRQWDPEALRRRIAVIFQDFVRYQLLVGENVGAGDVGRFDDAAAWEEASKRGMAHDFIAEMPDGYKTQLGKWFAEGRELSLGQWQKVALSRAFMRTTADIVILDEPTAAMDAEAEAKLFQQVREASDDKMVFLISHRFSTVRMADHIVVLDKGRVVEQGTHPQLMERNGRYARLFSLQAEGYR
jgi:ATP-binding cassette, subfamily B, bacterial